MPRKKRVWFPGAMYHIVSRGNRKSDIFRSWKDYEVYLKILKDSLAWNRCVLHSYCLMTNHVHLQVETTSVDVMYFMMDLNRNYAKYFNLKYDLVGHLFQSRYRSEILHEDDYIMQVSRYIHLNPLRARMVKNLEDYKWSSYPHYIGKAYDLFVNTELVLGFFKGGKDLYKDYVENYVQNQDIKNDKEGEDFNGVNS